MPMGANGDGLFVPMPKSPSPLAPIGKIILEKNLKKLLKILALI